MISRSNQDKPVVLFLAAGHSTFDILCKRSLLLLYARDDQQARLFQHETVFSFFELSERGLSGYVEVAHGTAYREGKAAEQT